MLQPQPAAPSSPTLPVWASVRDFCRLAGIGKTTCYAAMNAGHIPARRVGGKTLLNVAAGLTWINGHEPYLPN